MAKLQPRHLFGANVQFIATNTTVTASSSSPKMIIQLDDFISLNLSNGTPNAYAVFAAMIVSASDFFSTQVNLDDENNNLVVSRNWEALFDRTTDQGVIKKLGIRYGVDLFEVSTLPLDINPNNIF
jgi:hypothetical protein